MLSSLDVDVILQVLSWLGVEDLLSLRKTSKHFYTITHLRSVWHNALTNLLADNVPLARISLGPDDVGAQGFFNDFSTLSASDLEQLALATFREINIWEQKRPKRTRARRMKARVGRVFTLRFLRIHSVSSGDEQSGGPDEGRYLLSFGHTAAPTLCLQVWDADSNNAGEVEVRRPVAEWGVNGRVIGLAIDEGNALQEVAKVQRLPNHIRGSVIAVSSRDFDVPGAVSFLFRLLLFVPAGPSGGNLSALKTFRIRGPLNARAMRGSLVAVQVRADGTEDKKFGHGVLKVVDWVRSELIYAQSPEDVIGLETGILSSGREFAVKLEPSIHGRNRTVLRVDFIHDWVVVFRESVMEMYFLPPWSVTNQPQVKYPEAFHRWNWQINSCTVTERVSWVHERIAMTCRTCDRRGFITIPFPGAGKDVHQEREIVCTCRYRPLSVVARFDSYYPWPVNLLHHYVIHVNPNRSTPSLEAPVVPYLLPPQLTQTVPSTIRLFSHSVLVLGPFGTLLWTDSEANNVEDGGDGTEAYFAEGVGERVAGRRLRLPPPPECSSFSRSLVAQQLRQQEVDPNSVEILPLSVPGQTTHTSVFSTRLSEGWYSVALCECRGRIAIGDGEGNIELWDHF